MRPFLNSLLLQLICELQFRNNKMQAQSISIIEAIMKSLIASISQKIQAGTIQIGVQQQISSPECLDNNLIVKKNNLDRSSFSPQDKQRIKSLTKQIKRHQQSLKEKTKQFEESMKEQIKKQKEQEQIMIKQKWLEHRNLVLIKKKRRMQIKLKQQNLIKDHQSKFVPSKRLIYLENEKQSNQRKQKEELEIQEKIKNRQKSLEMLVNIQNLKDHQKNYQNFKKQLEKNLINKVKGKIKERQLLEKEWQQKKPKTKFYKNIIAYQQEQKSIQQQKQQMQYLLKQKVRALTKRIRSQVKLIHRKDSSLDLLHRQQKSRKKIYTQTQIRQIGNKYLKESLTLRLKQRTKSRNSEEDTKQETIQNSKIRQKTDYLKQIRHKRFKESSKSKSNQQLNILSFTTTRIDQIVNSKHNEQQKIEKLKKMAHRLQATQMNDTDKELAIIKAKIKILQASQLHF